MLLLYSHILELGTAWSDAADVLFDSQVEQAERVTLLGAVVRATKALAVYAVKPAGKLVCFSMSDSNFCASAVVVRIFLPSERADLLEPIFQFLSGKVKEMTGTKNLTRRYTALLATLHAGLRFRLHLTILDRAFPGCALYSADGGNRSNLVSIDGIPTCVTELLAKTKFTGVRNAQVFLTDHHKQCLDAIRKLWQAGGVGFIIPGSGNIESMTIQPVGWNLDDLEAKLTQFILQNKPMMLPP